MSMGFFSKLLGGGQTPEPRDDEAYELLSGRAVVAVETSATISKVLEMTFADADAKLQCFGTASEMMAAAQRLRPDVVLLSISTVGDDLDAVVHQIRAAWPHTKIVALDDRAHRLDDAEAARRGLDAVQGKPFRADRLLLAVAALLR
jgi:DNA-binding response OmpR family regulator